METVSVKELRIGNYLNHSNRVLSKVVEITENDFRVENEFGSLKSTWADLFPIPLTEDILLRLGLIKKNITEDMPEAFKQPDIDEYGNIWYNWVEGLFNLQIQTNGEIWFELYSHYKHVKYVHELQNLYHALTGQELTLNP
jgi:hypothetical protein